MAICEPSWSKHLRPERALFAVHGLALVFAVAVALAWPRAGEPAVLVPLGPGGIADAFVWADAEGAEFFAIKPESGRVIVRVPSNHSLLQALASGIVPVATRAAGCKAPDSRRTQSWKS